MMSSWLNAGRARLDALSLRERVVLFLTLAVLMLAVADEAVIAGRLQQQTAWRQEQTRQEAELTRLRTELRQLSTPQDPGQSDPTAPLRGQIAQALAERDSLAQQLAPVPASGAGRLPDLLARTLRQQPGVTLVQLDTGPGTAASAPTGDAGPGSDWRDVRLTVAGSYATLQDFVAALERDLPALRWGTLDLTTAPDGPPRLQLQLWLPGGAP